MATYLPSSGALSINDINTLFGRGNNLNAYRGTTYYTSSAGPYTFSSGAISISNFYSTGPSPNTFSFTISSNQANADLRSLAVAAGWNQSSAVIATVNGGVYIYSTSTGTAGLTISGSWPGGVTLVNNGYIMGKGGDGGVVSSATYSGSPGSGGPAISLGVSCSITNNSYIGGGGGAGGNAYTNPGSGASGSNTAVGGGGAGGGNGSGCCNTSSGFTAGGAGGGPGASGSDGGSGISMNSGGGGGRIMPGTGGAGTTVGGTKTAWTGKGGGSGGSGSAISATNYTVGGGGSAGSTGGNASATSGQSSWGGGGGGGWGASGGTAASGNANHIIRAPGSGGKCVALNGYSVTWNATGTRYGAIS